MKRPFPLRIGVRIGCLTMLLLLVPLLLIGIFSEPAKDTIVSRSATHRQSSLGADIPPLTSTAVGSLPPPVATSVAQATAHAGATATYESLTPQAVPTAQSFSVVAQHDYGAWRYRATRNNIDGRVIAQIMYDHSSVEKLRAYARANQGLANQFAHTSGSMKVSITFRTYVAPAQFRTWVQAHGIQVESSALRATAASSDGQGTDHITLIIGATDSDPLPQAVIDQDLAPPTPEGLRNTVSTQNSTLQGVFETDGIVPSAQLLTIANDPTVFLVDVNPAVVLQHLASVGVPDLTRVTIEGQKLGTFSYMEGLGLEHFR